jgi:type VI secretion system protein ImpF
VVDVEVLIKYTVAEIGKMSSQTPHERLQPSLLDRFQDDEPTKKTERSDQQILNLNQLRELIMRDLAWLMNCDNLECVQDLTNYPEVRTSVLNYGIPSFSGTTLSTTNSSVLENEVKKSILAFEPRIVPQSLTIRSAVGDSAAAGRKSISLEIGGKIWAQPFSLEFLLRSEMDLDTGQVVINQIRNLNQHAS